VKAELHLEQFSGPLDLLLHLIAEERLSVSEIALSKVTEQFMAHLDAMEGGRAEELADFLVVAARLLLIKSRLLLPQFAPEEDDGPVLEDQLRLYKLFADASRKLNRLWMGEEKASFRIEPPRRSADVLLPANATLASLHERMVQLIARLAPPKPLPETRIDKAISLKRKLDEIRAVLARAKTLSFHALLSDAKNRTEIIVSFLAVLELVKQHAATARQDEGFGDILIVRT
jgi:segregation and condensation protein A